MCEASYLCFGPRYVENADPKDDLNDDNDTDDNKHKTLMIESPDD
jgi:hypothetical protein